VPAYLADLEYSLITRTLSLWTLHPKPSGSRGRSNTLLDCPILPTAALSCQLPPHPDNCRPVLPTCRPLLPTAALSCELPPYPANYRHILTTVAISCQLPPYPANCRPRVAPTALPARNFHMSQLIPTTRALNQMPAQRADPS